MTEAELLFDQDRTPLYTIPQAAFYAGWRESTFRTWVMNRSLIHSVPRRTKGGPSLPFIALAEAQFYRELRRAGLSVRAISEGMAQVREQLGEQMLVKGMLAHNGVDILVRLDDRDATGEWMRARDSQGGIKGVIEVGLKPIEWGSDDKPIRVKLTRFIPDVVADPRYQFGRPILADSGVRVEDVMDLFNAGDPPKTVADEFGVAEETVVSIIRTYTSAAA